jgi:hypothetical protein
MADPQAAAATRLRNIEARTGKTFAQLRKVIADSGLDKVGEQRKHLMDTLGLGYGDANMLALLARQAGAPATASDDPLEAIYSGAKAPLRKLHERLMAQIARLGAHELAPKKSYVSLRRKKQFAMLGPATKDTIELGLNARSLPPSPRLKTMPPASMCQYTVRIGRPEEIDAELLGWVKTAYAAAG